MGAGAGVGGIPAELLGRLDDLWFENYAGWARAHPRGKVEEGGGWRIASLGSPWPFYNVATGVAGQDVDLPRLREAFAGSGGYRVWLRDGLERAESALDAAGFTSELELPAYVIDLTAAGGGTATAGSVSDDAIPGGYELSRARTREDVEECVWGDRWSPWMGVDDVLATFPDPWAMAQAADRRFYMARKEGRLVATGQSLMHHRVAGVYGMWTADAHRSKGLGATLLRLILADAADAGAAHATLTAARPDGGIYTRAGFRRCYAYRVYQDHNPGDA